ncbi:MAG: hypothetical protein JNN08_04075 [Bryobacterales bacterium]|nr:hypothetical protein [Bryobacterales bacterium]
MSRASGSGRVTSIATIRLQMRFGEAWRPNRRAILIYAGAILLPAAGLLWLGVQSIERQRQALAALTAGATHGTPWCATSQFSGKNWPHLNH